MAEKQASSRPVIIAGNWKMYKTSEEAVHYVETLAPLIKKSQASVYLAVPFTAIAATAKKAKALRSRLVIGAQNMHDAEEGAFTGEIAAIMLKEAGARFVVLGHSERRTIFKETDAFINKKLKKALSEKIQPIVCVGENLEERELQKTEEVLRERIEKSLEGIPPKSFKTLVLAYEPLWAIGTGKVAHPADVEKAHLFCRNVIRENWGEVAATQVPILYGGSVKPNNAADLLKEPDVDGLLVGGGSLIAESFYEIVEVSNSVQKTKDLS